MLSRRLTTAKDAHLVRAVNSPRAEHVEEHRFVGGQLGRGQVPCPKRVHVAEDVTRRNGRATIFPRKLFMVAILRA